MWSYSASSGTSTFTADSSGTLLEDRAPGGNYWYLQDGWGNVVALVDSHGNIVDSYSFDPQGNYTSKSEGVSQPFGYQGDTVGDGTGLYDTGNGYYNSQAGYSVDGSMWETPNAKRKGVRGGCPRESVWCMKITRKLVAYIRPLEGNHFNLVVRGVGQTEGQGDNFHINATQVTDSGKVVVQGVLVQGKKSIDDLNPYTIDPTDAGNIAIDAADMLSWITGEANLENTDFWYQAAYVGDENFTYMLCELVTSKVSGPDNVNCKQFSNLHESTITFSAEHDNISVLPMS